MSWLLIHDAVPRSWGGPGEDPGSAKVVTEVPALPGHAAALTTPWTLIGEAGGSRDDFLLGGELLAPLLATPDSVLFLYPRISFQDGGHMTYSIGLGYRQLLPETWGVLGVNAFFDHADYSGMPGFHQVGGGLEYLGHWFEARGNAYFSVSDTKLIDRQRWRSRETSTSTRSRSAWGAPYATGNQILQDRVRFTTTTQVQVTETRVFERRMAGMDGFDFELGPRLPTGSDAVQLRVLAGMYLYDNPFGSDLNGFKARAEARLWDRVYLDLAYYEDQQLMGGNVYAGVRVAIPLGRDAPSSADSSASVRERLRARLGEPVVREHRVQLADSGYLENRRLRERRVRESVRTARSVTGTALLLDDVIFVNNGGPVGNGIMAGSSNGTAERPFSTIQEGADAAGLNSTNTGRLWNVYTQHTPTGYVEDVTLSGSANFISSFTPVPGFGGMSFGGNTPRPVLDGGFIGVNIPVLGITAYEIQNGDADGFGVRLQASGSNQVEYAIRDNVFGEEVAAPISMISLDTARVFADIDGNRFSADSSGSGIAINANESSSFAATIGDNIFEGMTGVAALVATASGEGELELFINDNMVGGSYQRGLLIQGLDDSFIDVTILRNSFTPSNTTDNGILVRTFNNAFLGGQASFNLLDGAFANGIEASSSGASQLQFLISFNELTSTFDNSHGIRLGSGESSSLNAPAINNILDGEWLNGVFGRSEGSSTLTSIVDSNILPGTFGGSGILMQSADDSSLRLEALRNELTGGFNFGFQLGIEGNSTGTQPVIAANTLSGRFGNIGIWLTALQTSTVNNPVIMNNMLEGRFDNLGILVQGANSTTINNITLSGNILSGQFEPPFGEGIRVENQGDAQISGSVFDNELSGTFSFVGMRLITLGTGTTNIASFNGNQFTGTFNSTALWIDETAGTLTVNGTLNNAITGGVTDFLLRSTGNPDGTIIINGAPVMLPADITP